MKTLTAAILLSFSFGQYVNAETLPAPVGEVVLTVSGSIEHETSKNAVQLDLAMLKEMPQTQYSTKTIWLDGEKIFTGVSLHSLLERVGFSGTKIEAVALNDYKVEIPASEITPDAPIIAYLLDGEEMPARGKGPLWIVYPYDSDEKFRTEVVYSRSIWQLDRITSVK